MYSYDLAQARHSHNFIEGALPATLGVYHPACVYTKPGFPN